MLTQVAEFFEIDVRTVKRWIRRYKDDCLERKNRNSKSYKKNIILFNPIDNILTSFTSQFINYLCI